VLAADCSQKSRALTVEVSLVDAPRARIGLRSEDEVDDAVAVLAGTVVRVIADLPVHTVTAGIAGSSLNSSLNLYLSVNIDPCRHDTTRRRHIGAPTSLEKSWILAGKRKHTGLSVKPPGPQS
jgi:hypothetical protein